MVKNPHALSHAIASASATTFCTDRGRTSRQFVRRPALDAQDRPNLVAAARRVFGQPQLDLGVDVGSSRPRAVDVLSRPLARPDPVFPSNLSPSLADALADPAVLSYLERLLPWGRRRGRTCSTCISNEKLPLISFQDIAWPRIVADFC